MENRETHILALNDQHWLLLSGVNVQVLTLTIRPRILYFDRVREL